MEVKNISYDKDLDNVTLSIPLPQGSKSKEVYYTEDTFGINKRLKILAKLKIRY